MTISRRRIAYDAFGLGPKGITGLPDAIKHSAPHLSCMSLISFCITIAWIWPYWYLSCLCICSTVAWMRPYRYISGLNTTWWLSYMPVIFRMAYHSFALWMFVLVFTLVQYLDFGPFRRNCLRYNLIRSICNGIKRKPGNWTEEWYAYWSAAHLFRQLQNQPISLQQFLGVTPVDFSVHGLLSANVNGSGQAVQIWSGRLWVSRLGFFQRYLHVFSKYVVPNTNNTVSCFYILRLNNQF